jgi:hypothetical protein
MPPDNPAYNELLFYTLAHPSPDFLHQLAVDAYTAQHADAGTRPMAIVFALLGLYLSVERGVTGRQIQRLHMHLAQRPRDYPRLPLPADRGDLTIHDVLAAPAGAERDAAIHAWCAAVWQPWSFARPQLLPLIPTPLPA